MINQQKDINLAQIKNLIKEGYNDLGWANDGKEFSVSIETKNSSIRELNCSHYITPCTHKVYVDDERREILHVDLSD